MSYFWALLVPNPLKRTPTFSQRKKIIIFPSFIRIVGFPHIFAEVGPDYPDPKHHVVLVSRWCDSVFLNGFLRYLMFNKLIWCILLRFGSALRVVNKTMDRRWLAAISATIGKSFEQKPVDVRLWSSTYIDKGSAEWRFVSPLSNGSSMITSDLCDDWHIIRATDRQWSHLFSLRRFYVSFLRNGYDRLWSKRNDRYFIWATIWQGSAVTKTRTIWPDGGSFISAMYGTLFWVH